MHPLILKYYPDDKETEILYTNESMIEHAIAYEQLAISFLLYLL